MIPLYNAEHLKPKFLYAQDGTLLLQISVGGQTLTRALPSLETADEAQKYVNDLVPEMAKELYKRRRNKLKRDRKEM